MVRKGACNIEINAGEAMMEYRGYAAGPIDFDPEDKTFSGTVAGLRDVIHFEGGTASELERAFRESIDSYLELCGETGQQPDRPFNGKILVRRRSRSCTARQPCALRSRG
jgi:predicted HicB family RNase H-like nuclease